MHETKIEQGRDSEPATTHDPDRALERAELDREAREEAFDTFPRLVKSSVAADDVEKWVRASTIRQDLFDDLVVGTIRWPRTMGHPDSASLSDGFHITTSWWADVWHLGLDGTIVTDLQGWIRDDVPPELRDGLFESDHYSVRYLFRATGRSDPKGEPDVQVEVRLADVRWSRPGRAAHHRERFLSSHGFQFFRDGRFLKLPDITVSAQPFVLP